MGNVDLQELVALSNYLGSPDNEYAILGEGNTSARVDDDTFYVKASGTNLRTIDASGFVGVSISRVLTVLDDESAGDEAVTQVLKDACVDPDETRRPSVETMLHALLYEAMPDCRFVGHTHPTHTNAILCSHVAEEAMSGRIFPDHIVCMGHKSVYVPYVDPGLTLAREVRTRLRDFIDAEGVAPKAIVMQNHGLIAVGPSRHAVTSCTDMAEKVSKILVGSYSCGGPNFMTQHDIDRIYTRPDEHYRLKSIASR